MTRLGWATGDGCPYSVLHIISDTNIGGAGIHLLTFLESFDRDKLAVRVLCPVDSLLISRCQALDVPVFTSHYLAGDRSFGLSGLRGLCRELGVIVKENNISLVHTHASFSGRLAARILGVPCIVYTKHRQDWNPGGGWVKKQIIALLNRLTCHHAIAVSEGVRNDLVTGGLPAEKVTLIYNGVDLEKFIELAGKQDASEFAGKRVVGMVARLEPEKGHRHFLEAAALVLSVYPDVVFLVVGTGSLAESLSDLACSLGIGEQVVFTGFQQNAAGLIKMMDILVIPSLTEAFGITMVEGMCLGKPCVASNVGGLAEIAGMDGGKSPEDSTARLANLRELLNNSMEAHGNETAGLEGRIACLVPPGDYQCLAAEIRWLLENPEEAKAMGERGAKVAAARFSAKKTTQEITELYYLLIGDVDDA